MLLVSGTVKSLPDAQMRRTHLLSFLLCILSLATPEALQPSSVTAPVLHSDSNDSAVSGGKVFFLFMANDSLPNEEIWLRFLKPAKQGIEYQAFVHCQHESVCHEEIKNKNIFKMIPSVKSQWCEDLVSPMNALLEAALRSSDHGGGLPADRFTFVSDTTVPVKPFDEVHQRLVSNGVSGSSFCVTPQHWWAVMDKKSKKNLFVVKHHQWMTLTQEHAQKVVFAKKRLRNLMARARPAYLYGSSWLSSLYQATLGKLVPAHPDGCLDEYLYFSLIYGFLDSNRTTAKHQKEIEGFKGSPLHVSDNSSEDFQGQCDTYAFFGKRYGKKFNDLSAKLEEDSLTEMELKGLMRNLHPAQFNTLSSESLSLLRNSEFLFARKVDARNTKLVVKGLPMLWQRGKETKGNLPDAFDKFVFQSGQTSE
mmetsp:Transcript_28520/g.51955  ORF Transcript_28520/g.51955 Transcript_28520/m.51955 type:complete len:421 (-) Transcript_28520:149-1411(-)